MKSLKKMNSKNIYSILKIQFLYFHFYLMARIENLEIILSLFLKMEFMTNIKQLLS